MPMSKELINFIGRTIPGIFDVIPHGPLAVGQIGRGGLVALNPQPLPPKQRYLAASIELAQTVAQAAILAEVSGGDGGGVITRIVDEWCGTPWPRPFPWPGPIGPDPDPEPHPDWDIAGGRLAGAVTLAAIASQMQESDVRGQLQRAADQLMDVAIG